ncbi:MAG TPA: DNA-binding response regulator [Cyanobacteria bacterium UBA8543]|nr:DNA-binding response regulator [Cyanobacteria bacterium UBA8543]
MGEETVKKILVIDHQANSRDFFLEGLKAHGFDTISADNGRVGVQRAREELPNLIICDIMMPQLSGYGVLTTLRQDPSTAIIPFIFVTTKGYRSHLRRAMELGANDYLTKPCTIEQLVKAIAVQLKKQTLLEQWYAAQPQPVPQPSSTGPITFATVPQLNLPSDPPLSEVFRFIEANYHQAIALCDVAQAVGYSPAYLTSLTRRQTGQTVQRWIIERRMAAARSLLLETNQVVEQIAAQVGYHHVVHFFRQFRQLHGTTPHAWRIAHRH